jgi:hypothetical protein
LDEDDGDRREPEEHPESSEDEAVRVGNGAYSPRARASSTRFCRTNA